VINTTGWSEGRHTRWSEGRHTIFVQSLDSRGVWGEPRLVMLTVMKPEGALAAIVHQREIIFVGTVGLIVLIIALLHGIRWRRMK
jgi:hypothetical protein